MLTEDELLEFRDKLNTKMLELGEAQALAELKDDRDCAAKHQCLFQFLSLYRTAIFIIDHNYTPEELEDIVTWVTFVGGLQGVIPLSFTGDTIIIIDPGGGGGGGGVSSHDDLTNVDILTLTTELTGTPANNAWHINKGVATKLLELINAVPEPPEPQTGLFFTIFPGPPIINIDTVTETPSEISFNNNIIAIPGAPLVFGIAVEDHKRIDAIAVNAILGTYVIITGVEVEEGLSAPTPTIPADHLFVRYIDVSESIAPTDVSVKGIKVGSHPTIHYPDFVGVVDIPAVHTNRVQVDMVIDGTNTYIPTVDAVNAQANNISQVAVHTGFLRTDDGFTMGADLTPGVNQLLIGDSDYGIAFSQYFLTPPFAPSDGIKQLVGRSVPLSNLAVSNPIPLNSTTIKFVGWAMPSDTIVFSDNTFVQNPGICQLGYIFYQNNLGVYEFVSPTRTFINQPDIAAYSNLLTTTTGISSSTVVTAHTGLTMKHTAGSIKGISVNWGGGGNNDERPVNALTPFTFTYRHPASHLTLVVEAGTSTLDPTMYWNGTAMTLLTGANNAQVMRVMMSVRGTVVIQPGEFQFTNLLDARDAASSVTFTEVIPKGSYAEICRIAVRRGATNLASNTDAVFIAGTGGGGGGGNPAHTHTTADITDWATATSNFLTSTTGITAFTENDFGTIGIGGVVTPTTLNCSSRIQRITTNVSALSISNISILTNLKVGEWITYTIDSKHASDTLTGWLAASGSSSVNLNGVPGTSIIVEQIGFTFVPLAKNRINFRMVNSVTKMIEVQIYAV